MELAFNGINLESGVLKKQQQQQQTNKQTKKIKTNK